MYSTIITFKPDIPQDVFCSLQATCEKAFDNRAGKARGRIDAPNRLIYEGGEELYGCLQLGVLALDGADGFKDVVSRWDWIDEDPDENHDILESLAIPIYC